MVTINEKLFSTDLNNKLKNFIISELCSQICFSLLYSDVLFFSVPSPPSNQQHFHISWMRELHFVDFILGLVSPSILPLKSLLSLEMMLRDENNNKYKMVQSRVCCARLTHYKSSTIDCKRTSAPVFVDIHTLAILNGFVWVFYVFKTFTHSATFHKSTKHIQ